MPSLRRSVQSLALVAAISGCKKSEPVPQGDIAAALAIATADGGTFDPATLRGKPTIVLFASPTCPHCTAELPIAQRAAAAEAANVVAVYVVGEAKHAASVTRTSGFTAPVLVDDGTLRKKWAIRRVPWTLVLAANGRAEAAFTGEQDEATLRDAIDDAR